MKIGLTVQLIFTGFCLALCSGNSSAQTDRTPQKQAGAFVLKSAAFQDDAYIPAKYGCDIPQAQGTPMSSPPLEWVNAPKNTGSFALIMHDIGADPKRVIDENRLDVTHWVVYGIPARTTSLAEGIAVDVPIAN